MDVESAVMELSCQGFECSQILMLLALELEEAENPGLIRAMSGLCGGMGRSGGACGALTGSVCALGYFTGKGEAEEPGHGRAREIVADFARWFRQRYGGETCRDIIGGDFGKCMAVCVPMVGECYEKYVELLEEYEILPG